jgi:hypothetical protein
MRATFAAMLAALATAKAAAHYVATFARDHDRSILWLARTGLDRIADAPAAGPSIHIVVASAARAARRRRRITPGIAHDVVLGIHAVADFSGMLVATGSGGESRGCQQGQRNSSGFAHDPS